MTKRRDVVVYGAGGHGKVVADIVQLNAGLRLLGFIDDGFPVGPGPMGFQILGGRGWFETSEARNVEIVFGIGRNPIRMREGQDLAEKGLRILTVIHPAASVAATASVGAGTVVMANASINPDARVGRAAIINTGAVVEHDCEVGDFAHVSPNAAMGGGAKLGMGAWLGIGAVVKPLVSVGARTVVGAGAAVVKDLPEDCVAVGVPARVTQKVTVRP